MSIGRVPGATGIQPSIVTAKGDLIVATASGSVTNQAVGSNNQVLTADSAQADGVKWANGSAATLTTTGDILYASAANTPARLAIGSTDQVLKVSGGIPAWGAAPSPSFVGCVAYLTNNQSVSNDTTTAITLDAEVVDSDGFHSNTTNNTRMTVPSGKAGKYYVFANVGLANGDTATGTRRIYLRKNGTTELDYLTGAPAVTWFAQSVSTVMSLAVGDYVELFVNQSSGGTRSYYGDSSVTKACQLGIIYLGA